jgi:hypothetical protein
MSEIVLDQQSAEKLRNCERVTLLRGPDGKVIGYFEPKALHVYEPGEIPEFDEDELDRRVAKRDFIPHDEVRRRLLERRK